MFKYYVSKSDYSFYSYGLCTCYGQSRATMSRDCCVLYHSLYRVNVRILTHKEIVWLRLVDFPFSFASLNGTNKFLPPLAHICPSSYITVKTAT